MSIYRAAAVVAAAGLAGLSLTACQGGFTPAASSSSPPASSPPASSSPATPPSPPPSSPATSSPATSSTGTPASTGTSGEGEGTGSTVNVGGAVGSFPVPPGADVAEDVTNGSTTDIVLSGVSASEISSFYGSALPAAGYTITANTNATGADINGTAITFHGHGDKGDIGAATSLGIAGLSGLGLGNNIVGITLTRQ